MNRCPAAVVAARYQAAWRRLERPVAILIVALAALVALPRLAFPGDPPGTVVGYDFAQNVAAGRIVAGGKGDRLYDQELQFAERQAVIGPEGKILTPRDLPFLSTPSQAAFLAPFAQLPFRLLEPVHRAAEAAAFGWAMFLLRGWMPVHWSVATALGLASPVYALNAVAGQNTPLTLLLWAAAARLVQAGRLNGAALCLGLGLFKPQLVLPGVALLGIGGGWWGAVAVGTGHYLLSWVVTRDLLWPLAWLRASVPIATEYMEGTLNWSTPEYLVGIVLWLAAVAAWWRAPVRWRTHLVLLAPVVVMALLPYFMPYYQLLWALPLIGLVDLVRRTFAVRRAPAGDRHRGTLPRWLQDWRTRGRFSDTTPEQAIQSGPRE